MRIATNDAITTIFGLFREDIAGSAAALIELSYRLTEMDISLLEVTIGYQRERLEDVRTALFYLTIQTAVNSGKSYSKAGSAIREKGATSAEKGYESVSSDYKPFNYAGTQYSQNTEKYQTNAHGYFGGRGISRNPSVRTHPGGNDAAIEMFEEKSRGYIYEDSINTGIRRAMPDGGYVIYRWESRSGGPVVSFSGLSSIRDQKIHFID